jgi:hypothetical protein
MKTWLLSIALLALLSPFLRAAEGEAPKEEKADPTAAVDAKLKSFKFDLEAWAEGIPPKEVFVIDGTFRVGTKDGSKTLVVEPEPIVDAGAQLGESSVGASSIEAKVLASKRGRSYPRFGVSIHGMSGYRLIVNCAKKQLELIKGETVVKSAPFTWTTDVWTKVKLWAKQTEGSKWLISGKAWPATEAEPADPQITHSDPAFKGTGKATVWGTPFSEMPIFFDDLSITATAK